MQFFLCFWSSHTLHTLLTRMKIRAARASENRVRQLRVIGVACDTSASNSYERRTSIVEENAILMSPNATSLMLGTQDESYTHFSLHRNTTGNIMTRDLHTHAFLQVYNACPRGSDDSCRAHNKFTLLV